MPIPTGVALFYLYFICMKRRDLSILFIIAFFFQGCPYIASGDSDAPDKVSLKDLQGCQYFEKLYISSYSQESSLDCIEDCIVDSLFYRQKTVYKADTNFKDTDTSLTNPLWRFEKIVYDTSIVKTLGPRKDGFYYDNFQIGSNEENTDDYFRRYKNGWTLCKK